jgi:hypothetical protein
MLLLLPLDETKVSLVVRRYSGEMNGLIANLRRFENAYDGNTGLVLWTACRHGIFVEQVLILKL